MSEDQVGIAERVDQLEELTDKLAGELLDEHRGAADFARFEKYKDDPTGFLRDVLRAEPWSAQVEIAEAVRDHPQVVVRSSNGCGKDFLAARLALWWIYARGGFVLATGPTERQMRSVVMGEVRRAFRAASGLPGRLFEAALRIEGEDARGMLAFTTNEISALTGFHAPRLMAIVTEGQGCPGETFEALHADLTGSESRFLVLGNPLVPSGKFFDFCRSPHWRQFRISALDHPNVVEGREVIPGAVTRDFVKRIEQEYGGKASGVYQSRVLGEFPDTAEDTLCRRSWIDAANRCWQDRLYRDGFSLASWVFSLDVARFGEDNTVLAVRKGDVIETLESWHGASLMETCGKTIIQLEARGVGPPRESVGPGVDVWGQPPPRSAPVIVDATGIGSGVEDRLREQEIDVRGFYSSAAASDPRRFANLRAEAYWTIRRRLEEGTIGLPIDEELADELCFTKWTVDSSGRIQIEPKKELRARLGRSPDKADAVAMAFSVTESRPRWEIL